MAITVCMTGVNCTTSSAFMEWEVASSIGTLAVIRAVAMALPRDVVAGDAVETAGSTLVMVIETVLLALR